MAKLYALNKIILPDNTVVERRSVFDGTPAQAKQFDKLGAARPATEAEIKAAAEKKAAEDGVSLDEPQLDLAVKPASGAPGDPQGAPKGKSA